jgi:D-alanine-D-alanine ligase
MTDDDDLTVLEANVLPGLTDTSLLPLAAEAAGFGFVEFVARVLDLAVARAATA